MASPDPLWLTPVRDHVAALVRGDAGAGRVVPPGVLRSDPEAAVLDSPEQPSTGVDRRFAVRYRGRLDDPETSNPMCRTARATVRLEVAASYRYDGEPATADDRAGVDRMEPARLRAGEDMHVVLRCLTHRENWGLLPNGVRVLSIAPDGEHAVTDPANGVALLSLQLVLVHVEYDRSTTWAMGAAAPAPEP